MNAHTVTNKQTGLERDRATIGETRVAGGCASATASVGGEASAAAIASSSRTSG